MTDEDLLSYLNLHGDRIRLRHFIRSRKVEVKKETKRGNLLSLLREKIEDRGKPKKNKRKQIDSSSDEDEMRKTKRSFGNRNAAKNTRLIELGWIHRSKTGSVQVRQKKGGGTRRININKDATKSRLLEEGKKLFFPEGDSSKGPLSNFDFDIWDFRDRSINNHKTVKETYDETKMPLLRFYFATSESSGLKNNLMESDTDSLPEISFYGVDIPANGPLFEGTASTNEDILSKAIDIAGIGPEDNSDNSFNVENEIHAVSNTTINSGTCILKEHNIRLHRGHLLREFIEAFKQFDPFNDIINLEIILPNGVPEAAEDGGGVTRDAISEFWNSFYEECTLGNKFKVPCLRHDYGEDEWRSIAKIIVFGWKVIQYFPIQLSIAFLQHCLYGNVKTDLKTAFLAYIPEADSFILESAMRDINTVDSEELLDIFEQHKGKSIPKQDNIHRLVTEIAHKELIQSGMFIIDCWSPLLKQIVMREDRLDSLYSELSPTPKRVTTLFTFPDSMSAEEGTVSNHLRRFVRELDNVSLRKFLRFCTGSDLLICKKIEIAFVNVTGIGRRPVAHTCSCLLELPKSYESFPHFRTEFMSILNSNVWVMDII